MSQSEHLAQLKGESDKNYANFLTFYDLGPKRTIKLAYCKVTGADVNSPRSGGWREVAARYKWLDRAEAHDKAIAVECSKSREQALKEHADEVIQSSLELVQMVRSAGKADKQDFRENHALKLLTMFGKCKALDAITNSYKALHGEKHEINIGPSRTVFKRVRPDSQEG